MFINIVQSLEGKTDATLQVIQPANELTCPGGEVILTCTVPPAAGATSTLQWQLLDSTVNSPAQVPSTANLGNFTIIFVISQDNYVISNATLSEILLSHNNITIGCRNPATQILPVTAYVIVAGM